MNPKLTLNKNEFFNRPLNYVAFKIRGFMGNPRAGKTISMVADGNNTFIDIKDNAEILKHKKHLTVLEQERLKIFDSFEIMSNLHLNKDIYGNFTYLDADTLLQYYKDKKPLEYKLIMLDDFFKKVDSRNFMADSNKVYSYFFTEIGKRHSILLYVSHFTSMVEKRLKNLTEDFVLCQKGYFDKLEIGKNLFDIFIEDEDYYNLKDEKELKKMVIRQLYLKRFIDLSKIDSDIDFERKVYREEFLEAYKYFKHYKTGEII